MTQLFANNAYGSLGATLTDTATSLTLASGQGARFPTPTGGDYFTLTLVGLDSNGNENAWEIVKVTGRSTDALTIVRAQESTTAATWIAGTRVELRATAGTLDSFTDTAQAAAAAPVQSVAGRTGAVTLTNTDVGLGNVENKSSATIRGELTSGNVTTALGFTPENAANKGAANGYAPLGSDSKIASTYLPSYVDDVLEYANFAALPAIGEAGKIYVLTTPYTSGGITSSQFRWSGSAYAAIIASPGTTDAVTEGSSNLYFTNARAIAATAATYLALAGGTLTGDLTFSGTNRRIIGDFTSTTRLLVQTSSANSNTVFGLIPTGTSVNSQFHVWGASDITNAPLGAFTINSSSVQIQSSAAGTGTVLPFRVLVGTTEVFRATTGYNFLIGNTVDDGVNKLQVNGGVAVTGVLSVSSTINALTVGRGAGAVATNTALGANALDGSNTGGYNTAIGNLTLHANTSGVANSAFGQQALTANTSGSNNTAVGNGALLANTTGGSNTAIGQVALASNTTASNNTAVGYQAAYNNTTATATTALGYRAAYSNTNTNGVTAIGYSAAQTLSNGNTNNYGEVYIGDSAGLNATTATDTVAVGSNSLRSLTTGIQNVAIGAAALRNTTTASYNTAVGYQAGYAVTTGIENTLIGGNAGNQITTGYRNTILGRYNGNQGGLDIRTANNYIVLSDGDGNPRAWINSAGNFLFQNAYTSTALFNTWSSSSVYAWINQSATTGTHLVASFQNVAGTQVGSITANNAATTYATSSDYRLKNITGPVTGEEAKAFIMALEPEQGTWKVDGSKFVGFVAHKFQSVSPGSVIGEKDAVDADGKPVMQAMQASSPEVMANLVALVQKLVTENEQLTTRLAAAGI